MEDTDNLMGILRTKHSPRLIAGNSERDCTHVVTRCSGRLSDKQRGGPPTSDATPHFGAPARRDLEE